MLARCGNGCYGKCSVVMNIDELYSKIRNLPSSNELEEVESNTSLLKEKGLKDWANSDGLNSALGKIFPDGQYHVISPASFLVSPSDNGDITGAVEFQRLLKEFIIEDGDIVNPFKMKSSKNTRLLRNKTDSHDVYAIAEYCKMYNPRTWQPDSKEKSEPKNLYRELESCKIELARQNNKLGVFIGNEKLFKIKKTVAHIEGQIKKIEALIEEFVSENKTIPEIANTTATALQAELSELSNFKTARELAAHIGITPQHNVSGKAIYERASISKMGGVILRKILYFPLRAASIHNNYLSDFSLKLRQKSKVNMVAIIAVMSKMVHIIYRVLKGGEEYKEQKNNILAT